MLWIWIGVGMATASLLAAAIHYWLQRRKQQRALCALRWIENSLGPAGHVSAMRWLDASTFEVSLKVVHPIFHRAYVHVRLAAGSVIRRQRPKDTLAFYADLEHKPAFAMSFENLRWFARSSRTLSTDAPGWQALNCDPVVLTTRLDWNQETTKAIHTVLHGDRRDHMTITYRRSSPNFCASMELDAIDPDQSEPLELLEAMRALAEGIVLKKAS